MKGVKSWKVSSKDVCWLKTIEVLVPVKLDLSYRNKAVSEKVYYVWIGSIDNWETSILINMNLRHHEKNNTNYYDTNGFFDKRRL